MSRADVGAAAERDFELTDRDFECVRRMVGEQAGIALSPAKRDMVYSRLSRRLRQLGLDSFAGYCARLRDGDPEEMVEFVNALTTNLTSFFRENHHFEHLARRLLPELMRTNAHSRRIRIWSAGCSTGEEPYSLAMTVLETLPEGGAWDVKILATDLDSNVVAKGQAGIYPLERVNGLSAQRRHRWFLLGKGTREGAVRVRPELQSLIRFQQLNLMQPWPMRGPFDVIFCRNVVIYFDKPTQRVLFDRYADILTEGGHLFIGHSESLFKVTERFELLGQTIYRKRH